MKNSRLSLMEHFAELRKRIIICSLSIILFTTLSYYFIDNITEFILKPGKNLEFIYLSPTELFLEYIKVSLICGVILSLPIILYQIWRFIKPGLEKKERKIILIISYVGSVFFLIGSMFAYFFVIPIIIKFLVNLSLGVKKIDPLFSFSSYVSFFYNMLITFGAMFELPLIIIILTYMNLISIKTLKKHRKIVVLIVFIVATVVTPPDIVSQLLMALPMILLYEISIVFSFIIGLKKRKKSKI